MATDRITKGLLDKTPPGPKDVFVWDSKLGLF
jgi:hypothetical protein